ncbi:MAG: LamG domain-containing protein [Candidatus Aenigmatarchaeota archaeon]
MRGISPLVSMVLVIAFGFTVMTIVLTVVNPLLDRAKDSGIVNEATQNMQLLDAAIKAVASEAKGSKRTISIKITDGVLRTDSEKDWVYLDFEPRTKTVLDGFVGDIKIESRPVFLEYFNRYKDGDNANDTWTAVNGTWSISGGRFLGRGGIAYHNVGNQAGFDLAATVVRSSAPDGQVYVVPGDPRNLVLYIPFDGNVNTSETIAYDYSAYKNNGTLYNGSVICAGGNCPTWVDGKFGKALRFDGVDDYVNLGTSSILGPANEISVAAWVKTPSTISVLNNYNQIVARGTTDVDGYNLYYYHLSAKFAFILKVNNTGWGTDWAIGTTTPQPDTWYHLVGVRRSNGYVEIWVNGVMESQDTTVNSGEINYSTSPVAYIGRKPSGNFWNGTIDEVMVFNRALSPDEIKFLYESSVKKITTAGEIPTISPSITGTVNTTIVLASPGSSYFDNVKLKSGPAKIRFVAPYQNIDIVNQTRFGPGDHNIVIRHYGTNTTSNKPMIGLEE